MCCLGGQCQWRVLVCTYDGALNAELFVDYLQQLMKYRRKPVTLVLDSLPAHKKAVVRDYVDSPQGKLTLHFLPGYAPDLNPDELVWSHVKRTGIARNRCSKAKSCSRGSTPICRRFNATQARPLILPRSFCRLYCRLLSKYCTADVQFQP